MRKRGGLIPRPRSNQAQKNGPSLFGLVCVIGSRVQPSKFPFSGANFAYDTGRIAVSLNTFPSSTFEESITPRMTGARSYIEGTCALDRTRTRISHNVKHRHRATCTKAIDRSALLSDRIAMGAEVRRRATFRI
jgi:hypothetical protein